MKNNILRSEIKSEWGILAFAFLFAFILRQALYVRLFPDSIQYLTFARNILSGIHHTGDISLLRYKWSPLYPHLVALFSLGNFEPAFLAEVGRQVSILTGCLLIFPIYFLTRNIFGKTAASMSALLVILTPEFIYYSSAVLTESLSILFVALSMFILYVTTKKQFSPLLCLILGIFLGLAFLSRHATIGYLFIALLWCFSSWVLKRRTKNSSVSFKTITIAGFLVLLGFFLIISPQIFYLHSKTGKWALVIDPSTDPFKRLSIAGEDQRYTKEYESRYEGLTRNAENFFWEVEKPPGLLTTAVKYPVPFFKAYIKTVVSGYLPDTYPLPYPLIVLLFTAAGIIVLIITRRFKIFFFFLWSFGGYYFFLALFHNMRDRYMFLAYPVILIVAGGGASAVARLVPKLFKNTQTSRKAGWAASTAIIVLCVALLLPASAGLIKKQNAMANIDLFMRLGNDLSQRIQKNALIFDRTPHLAYFAGGISTSVPYSSIENVIKFGRNRGVRYWIVSSGYVPWLRPQFKTLLKPSNKYEGLRTVAVYMSDKYRVIVYEILPEKGG